MSCLSMIYVIYPIMINVIWPTKMFQPQWAGVVIWVDKFMSCHPCLSALPISNDQSSDTCKSTGTSHDELRHSGHEISDNELFWLHQNHSLDIFANDLNNICALPCALPCVASAAVSLQVRLIGFSGIHKKPILVSRIFCKFDLNC